MVDSSHNYQIRLPGLTEEHDTAVYSSSINSGNSSGAGYSSTAAAVDGSFVVWLMPDVGDEILNGAFTADEKAVSAE